MKITSNYVFMTKKAKVILWIVLIVVVIGVIVAVNRGSVKSSKAEPIKIGFIGPLTGDVAGLGTASRSAVELAVEEANAAGGIDGRTIEAIYEDGQCSPVPATSASRKLISVDKVSAIIGGLCSSETSAFAPSAMENKTIVVSYCSSAPALSNTGKYFFRTYPSDAYQGIFAAEYAYNTLGARKIAIIYHISDWGTGIKDVFSKRFAELGGTIVAIEGTPQDARDYRTQISKVKSSGFDYVYIPVYSEGGIVLTKQLKDASISANKILGTEVFNDPKFMKETKGVADGMIITYSQISPTDEFKQKMLAKTGGVDVPICAPQAYDAVNVLVAALKQAGTDPEKLQQALRTISITGQSGPISFDENGDPRTANFVVSKIKDGALVPVQ